MIELRFDVLNYLDANPVTGFKVTHELPWETPAQPLYLKNKKVLYVDRPQSIQEPLIDALDGSGAVMETITVDVYVSNDAKTLPSNYNDMCSVVRNARLITGNTTGLTQRLTIVETEYEEDVLITRFELNFTKFICN